MDNVRGIGATTFTVKRGEWFRGNPVSSKLVCMRDDKVKRCCLGFYGNQIVGLSDADMRNISTPRRTVRGDENIEARWGGIVTRSHTGIAEHTTLGESLMQTNDNPDLSDEEREESLRDLFLRLGVTVLFVD